MISAEVLVGNSSKSQDVSASAAATCVSFFQKRDMGNSATIEEKSAIPTKKSPSSDFMLDFVEHGIDAGDIEAALAERTIVATINVVLGMTNFSMKSVVNASAPQDGQEQQTRKEKEKEQEMLYCSSLTPPIMTLVHVGR